MDSYQAYLSFADKYPNKIIVNILKCSIIKSEYVLIIIFLKLFMDSGIESRFINLWENNALKEALGLISSFEVKRMLGPSSEVALYEHLIVKFYLIINY